MDDKQTILIVEDEVVNRKILKKMLSGTYNILEAENGEVAWGILTDEHITVAAVLLDIVMPVLNGYGVLARIRQAHLQGLPVLVMTGETDSESERRALDAGAWDFVTKPFDVRVLSSRLSNAIARSKMSMVDELRHMAQHDPLTGLYNRTKMFGDTQRLVREHPEQTFVFLRVDINRFALYNASFGEEEGDKLLCYFARLFEKAMAPCGAVYGRVSGDVFCACLPFEGDRQKLIRETEEEQRQLAAYSDDYLLELTVGAYIIETPGQSAEDYYRNATMGAQKCKTQYGVCVGFYDDAMGRLLDNDISVSNDMQAALDNEEFLVYFQPKFLLSNDTACGAEALVRWQHPTKGMISPGVFIPVFERNGFVAKLDYYMWDKTCRALHDWIAAGAKPCPVSVNISRISLYNPNLVGVMTGLVEKYGIEPKLLELEITESAYMTNPDRMRVTIHALRQAGFTILMDDFGSAYSSLNTLKSIEIDVLKVDMKFLPVGDETEKGEIILSSVIHMASWLGMAVIVEGVETRRQRDFLEGAGCDCVQGYYYSRPIPQAEYEKNYVFAPAAEGNLPRLGADAPLHNVTILVIDDSAMDREILSGYFSDRFYVQECESAEAGLAYLKNHKNRVRLILVDNVMPGMSGMEFLKYCREEPALREIPQIMITANDSTEDQLAAFRQGAYDYITKPLVRDVVMARVNHVMDVSSQLTAHERSEQEYRHQAELDKDTGLLNKVSFREECDKRLEGSTVSDKAMMVLDVDDFKAVNDEYGHMMGDAVLKTIAAELTAVFRKSDVLGRFGGDEFVVLLSALSDSARAKRKAEEIIKYVTFACLETYHFNVNLSIGIAQSALNDTYNTLFARADSALYEAKRTGKGKAVVYGEKVPPILDDDKPVVLVCGEDPQLYPSIALAYGSSASFANITSLEQLKAAFKNYGSRVCALCLDMQKKQMADADEFYRVILANGGGTRAPLIAVCKEGDMTQLRQALELDIQGVITLPPQSDVIQRRLSRAILSAAAGRGESDGAGKTAE